MNVPLPPHQPSGLTSWSEFGDAAGYFPDRDSAESYAAGISVDPYHIDRREALRELVASFSRTRNASPVRVLDFGIGDGQELASLELNIASLTGVDVSPVMIELASETFRTISFTGLVGSVEALQTVESASIDLVTCINTLGYLTPEDEAQFMKEARRVMTPEGALLVLTGNSLFDLFAMNSGTAEFFEQQFDVPCMADLLVEGHSGRFVTARRLNPLALEDFLHAHGFVEFCRTFASWHSQPPVVLVREGLSLIEARSAARDYSVRFSAMPKTQQWRCLFQCTIVGFLASPSL